MQDLLLMYKVKTKKLWYSDFCEKIFKYAFKPIQSYSFILFIQISLRWSSQTTKATESQKVIDPKNIFGY